jgi:predicted SnoaL-like aldol condensation-catalyzing enzyme
VSVEEKNKLLVREFLGEAWGKGNMAAVDEYMAAYYVEHPRPSNLPPGTEGLKQLIAAYRTAFPDLKVALDNIFAEGEMVALHWSVNGTHLGRPSDPTGALARGDSRALRLAAGSLLQAG